MRRFVEWFTRRQALSELELERQSRASMDLPLARARAALELAERALEPRRPLDLAGAPVLALARQALHGVLAARAGQTAPTLGEQWDGADVEWLAAAAGDDVAELRGIATDSTFTEIAELDEDELRGRAERVLAFSRALFESVESRDAPLYRVRFQRAYRLALAVAAPILAVWLLIDLAVVHARGPDLAAGKPWKTSSALGNCPLGSTGVCEGQRVDIFFCTNVESSPWIEYDLGAPTSISRVLIENRSDCCEDRAVPLVVEVSDDGKQYRGVSRRVRRFDEVMLRFPATTTRYVRLRVERDSALHLERVSVYR